MRRGKSGWRRVLTRHEMESWARSVGRGIGRGKVVVAVQKNLGEFIGVRDKSGTAIIPSRSDNGIVFSVDERPW